jgi:hypothetical protein
MNYTINKGDTKMNICILDTETTSIDKPFCYNVGYIIYNTLQKKILLQKDFVVEQIWHNLPLFHTAYYAEKRPLYINSLRAKKSKLEKMGFITQRMLHTFKHFNVKGIYAYNSDFDERVFNYNCDWFKIISPLESLPIFDIRGYAHNFITCSEGFTDFCELYQLFTEAQNYSTTAEAIYKFITLSPEFTEDHMALSDCKIELEILKNCMRRGAEWQVEYPTTRSIIRDVPKPLKLVVNNNILYNGTYRKKYIRLGTYKFTT